MSTGPRPGHADAEQREATGLPELLRAPSPRDPALGPFCLGKGEKSQERSGS